MYAYIPDILLVLISSLACLYRMLLSRRLKKLQSLEGGLGASIVSLTQAITNTSEAAKQAREATEESVEILRDLLREAQDTLPLVEARIESLRYSRNAAKTAHAKLDDILTQELKPELQNAHNASKSLLQIVSEVAEFRNLINTTMPAKPKRVQEQIQSIEQERAA